MILEIALGFEIGHLLDFAIYVRIDQNWMLRKKVAFAVGMVPVTREVVVGFETR